MKRMTLPAVVGFAFTLAGGLALAQEVPADDDELTMTLIEDPEAELPEAVTRTIALPDQASDEGRERSARGLETANEARERRMQGLDTAAEARERGRELGAEMAEQAQERRENTGRGREGLDLPARPENLPTPPVTPPAGPPGS